MATLGRIARGEVAPLRELFQVHGPRLLGLVLGILKNRAEAEEVIQEVFLEVWKRAGEYDSRRGAIGGWLVVLARTRAIDRLRSRSSAERALQAHPSDPLLRTSEEPSPLQAAEAQQERDVVREVLAQLPEAQRVAIQLSYFEGLSQREIAESRGEPLGTVKTRIRLALEKLHALLEGKGLS
jgi:RNA polymerase sigma-70 factor (ECF subfamily)